MRRRGRGREKGLLVEDDEEEDEDVLFIGVGGTGIVVGLLRTMLEPETTEEHRKALEEPETSALFGSLRHTLDPTVRAERLEGLEVRVGKGVGVFLLGEERNGEKREGGGRSRFCSRFWTWQGDVRAYNASVERMLGAIRDARSAR